MTNELRTISYLGFRKKKVWQILSEDAENSAKSTMHPYISWLQTCTGGGEGGRFAWIHGLVPKSLQFERFFLIHLILELGLCNLIIP